MYFALHISASSTPRVSEAILFLVYSFLYVYTYLSKERHASVNDIFFGFILFLKLGLTLILCVYQHDAYMYTSLQLGFKVPLTLLYSPFCSDHSSEKIISSIFSEFSKFEKPMPLWFSAELQGEWAKLVCDVSQGSHFTWRDPQLA